MAPDFDSRLSAMAEVIVRIGLNLQPGQPLLVTDPYDLQGAHPETESLVASIRSIVPGVEVLPADPTRLRTLVATDNLAGYESLVSRHTRRLRQHLARGGAFLFLTGTAPQLLSGLPANRLQRFDATKWRHLGPLIQSLVRGASQWTLIPVPTSDWAAASDLTLPALWETVSTSLRVGPALAAGPGSPPAAFISWSNHLAALNQHRDALNRARHCRLRYLGPGTDLTLELPRSHAWCTAQLTTKTGVPFVANLPTEEVFTAPHKNTAEGRVRISRPVVHGGAVIEGIELEFHRGQVVQARATAGEDLLRQLLATDSGASRLGEVALIPALDGPRLPAIATATADPCMRDPSASWQNSRPLFHHTLLDENAAPHIALGESYRFCSRAWFPLALNRSQLHLDLPLDAKVEFS
jgi:aminopeptidase